MLIAIHDRPGSFSDRWLEYCAVRGLPVCKVDMFRTDLFPFLRSAGAGALLLHPPMADPRTMLAARAIVEAAQLSGLRVFPSVQDFWHFDDKIAQKYLFEALEIPSPTTYVFYDEPGALQWAESADFPAVFKLRAGAGSVNVRLARTHAQARALIRRMFGRGFHATNGAVRDLRTKVRAHNKQRDWLGVLTRAPQTLHTLWRGWRDVPVERGYVYFQKFLAGNAWDTRITVIGDRAFGFRRLVRPGDFRASGSGSIEYDPAAIDLRAVALAFKAAQRLRTSCMAFDFVVDPETAEPLIVEMSFAFKPETVYACPGHWSAKLEWRAGQVWPQDAILDDFVAGCSRA